MALVDHLKNDDPTNKVLAIASGVHVAQGHLAFSYTIGTSPNHRIVVRHAIADARSGKWNKVKAVYFSGLNVPASDYEVFYGRQTATGTLFNTDIPRYGTVILDAKGSMGVGNADTKANPPVGDSGLIGIFETGQFPDFDGFGNQVIPGTSTIVSAFGGALNETYFSYTTNPARVLAGWYLEYCEDASAADINWTVWTQWRDYLAAPETVDYTTLANFDGFGLTGKYYSDQSFTNLLETRIDPSLYFANSSGTPAAGQSATGFSVRWTGFIKPQYSETYTFKLTHDNSGKVIIGGTTVINQTSVGTHTGTIALTAGQFYPITVEWADFGAPSELSLSWFSSSRSEEIIPPEALYPAVESRPRYEAHISFSTPATIDQMIDAILLCSNSIRQDVGGKMEFRCIEQLTPTFHIQEGQNHILDDVINFHRSDRRSSDPFNVYEAVFNDIDSKYLEKPVSPIQIEIPELLKLTGNRRIVSTINFAGQGRTINMNRWQALKILKRLADEAVNDLEVSFTGRAALYPVVQGDLVKLTHPDGAFEETAFSVKEATDNSSEETADTRRFLLIESSYQNT